MYETMGSSEGPADEIKQEDARLNPRDVLALLTSEGPFGRMLKGFEPREQQQAMMCDIIEAFNHDKIGLIEAGTGTGKSLAYLIPSILWSKKYNERTVISTNTINLQEQLLHKDIPLVAKALGIEFKAVLLKGMSNFVCLRKLDELKYELPLLTPQELQEVEAIQSWRANTQDGSRSTLPIVPSSAIWEKVGAEADTCTNRDCPYFKDCFYFKARKQAQDAQILIVNHYMLFSDLLLRNDEFKGDDAGILPSYSRVIIDEAHHIEDIATDFFANSLTQLGFLRCLSRLASDKQGKTHGKLPILKNIIVDHYRKRDPQQIAKVLASLTTDLPAMRWDLWTRTVTLCEALREFVKKLGKSSDETGSGDHKLRFLPHHGSHPEWINGVVPQANQMIEATGVYVQALGTLQREIVGLKQEKLTENTMGTLLEISALARRLDDGSLLLKKFIQPDVPLGKVRWIETQHQYAALTTNVQEADLDISKGLVNYLFGKIRTTVLVSATMTSNQNFAYFRKRLGLTPELINKEVIEKKYLSPFNYEKQTMLAIPTDMPEPSHSDFSAAAAQKIWMTVQASHGNAFILFTSYSMLKSCYEALEAKMKEQHYHPMKQGDMNRGALLAKFTNTNRSILFGTDSFWEGVDVAGEALRCVIIVKLPFKVPSEPIFQARSEVISSQGGDPFSEYSLPLAILKFKQGVGRLIRHKRDRGCIVCLDNRLLNKRYGPLFLGSLPKCQTVFAEMTTIQKEMAAFYKKTHYLTL